MGTKYHIAADVKEQILKRLKEDGVPAVQLAEEHGISVYTIYAWLSKRITGYPTLKEVIKLKKQNKQLFELVGELTVKLSQKQKRG